MMGTILALLGVALFSVAPIERTLKRWRLR